jgi:hypothetical protein
VYIEEVVYLGRDNSIALSLSSDGAAIVHNALTRVQVLAGATLIDSAVSPALFDLTKADRITLKFRLAGLTTGRYPCTLVVFDTLNTNGLVWGGFVIVVK